MNIAGSRAKPVARSLNGEVDMEVTLLKNLAFPKSANRPFAIVLVILITAIAIAQFGAAESSGVARLRSSQANNPQAITVRAAGRAKPYLNFQDGRQMRVDYRGEQSVIQALQSGQVRARSLAV